MLIDLNYVMQRALSAHAVCTISPCKGTMGSRAGDNGGCGRLVRGRVTRCTAQQHGRDFQLAFSSAVDVPGFCAARDNGILLDSMLGGNWESTDPILLVFWFYLSLFFLMTFLIINSIWPTPHNSDSGFAEVADCILHVGSSSVAFPEISWHKCSYAYNIRGWKNHNYFFLKEWFFNSQ